MIFEGFFDFLSFVEIWGTPKMGVIVLNSLSNVKKAYPYIEQASQVYLLLDNDNKGIETTQKLAQKFGAKVISESQVFAPYKDMNEYLIHRHERR
jgi:5S rRNA maturation endonuclease (ribonuclease M5)